MSADLRSQIERALFRSGADNYDLAVDMIHTEIVGPLHATVERVRGVCEALAVTADEAEADGSRAVIDARKVLAAFVAALDGTA